MTYNAMILHTDNTVMRAYGDRDDVRELGDRLMAMHPAAADVGANAMRAAAQLALLLGANPLPGVNEVHIWRDNKGRNCMTLGINYWRRKAQEWGGYVYEIRPRPMRPEELAEYGIANGTMAAICTGARTADMLSFKALGFTTNEIWDMCGRTGVGTQGANEYAKSGRPNVWTSLKRAETDMLRQLFPAEFAALDRQAIADDAPIIITTADAIDEDDEPAPKRRYTAAELNDDLFPRSRSASKSVTPDVDDGEYEDAPPVDPVVDVTPATNGRDIPLPDDELVISEAAAKEFITTAAAVLETDGDTVKAHLKVLGYAAIPGKTEERLAAYRRLKDDLAEADQGDLFTDADQPAPAATGAFEEN